MQQIFSEATSIFGMIGEVRSIVFIVVFMAFMLFKAKKNT